MKKIIYRIDATAVPDHKSESSDDETIEVSTENFIYAARVLIKEKLISYLEVQFILNDEIYIVDNDGRFIKNYPKVICVVDDFLKRLI